MHQIQILSILDDFTFQGLNKNKKIKLISKKPFWYLKSNKIDFLLVESAWRGHNDHWRHKIASYPDHPERNNQEIAKLVYWAKQNHIPTVFWNKEDPYHYDQFIATAKLFDYIFTTDNTSVARYQKDAPKAKINILPFFLQSDLHYAQNVAVKNRSLFVGSYHETEHPERKRWQDHIFPQAAQYGLTIVDRHSESKNTLQKFPQYAGDVEYLATIPHDQTHRIYNQFSHCLNVNSITHSKTMFSRRILEIMGCGKLMISNPSLAIDHLFSDMCITLSSTDHATDLFAQLKYGYTKEQIEMCKYAQNHVHQHYNADSWINKILEVIHL